MATDKFIPEIWAAHLLEHLDKVHVYTALFNHDYEGEIKKYGDTVHINQIGDIDVDDYEGSLPDPQELDGTQLDLTIDQKKYFNFLVDDVDNAQTNPKLMGHAMQRASYSMNDKVDQFAAGLMAAHATVFNAETSPIVPTVSTAYDYLVDLGTTLSEHNVPMQGRWVVIPFWYHGLLQKDERFVGNGTSFNKAILEGGLIGDAAGFDVYVSNNVPAVYNKTTDSDIDTGKTYFTKRADGIFVPVKSPVKGSISGYYEKDATKFKVLAGTNAAGTYAEQLIKLDAFRSQKAFADVVRGLHVFGAKIVQPDALACMTCSKS